MAGRYNSRRFYHGSVGGFDSGGEGTYGKEKASKDKANGGEDGLEALAQAS